MLTRLVKRFEDAVEEPLHIELADEMERELNG